MQFFLDGFRTGDPGVSDAARSGTPPDPSAPLPEQVDVLVVGSGPTGLTLAAQLAAFPGVTTGLIEQKPGPLELGQADGIACRTMEMFEAFGFSERVLREAYWVNETSFWEPDRQRPEHIVRSRTVQDVEDGLSEFPHVILNQARIHDFYLDLLRKAPTPLHPTYGTRIVGLTVDDALRDDPRAHPVQVQVERGQGTDAARVEHLRARYVVGCDGARSAVRTLMGRTLDGDSAGQAWGVMDILAVTDFPDIRRKAVIKSGTEGSLLIIPREGGYLVRFYIELDKLAANQRVSSLNVTPEHLVAAARRILRPWTLEVKEVAWWSVYEIGQRLCARFDDLADDSAGERLPRVFIAGDACHTHSPKAGQGMNVSMQDAFNLGWKLGSVLRGRARPQLLRTYSAERREVAQELIDFDHRFARMFSARPKGAAGAGDDAVDPAAFRDYFLQQGRFTAGTATHYAPSLVTGPATHQSLARGFIVGMRFHSAPVLRLADAKPVQLGHVVRADGRWRLFAFADAAPVTSATSRLAGLCRFLAEAADSPLRRHTPPGDNVDSVIEVVGILQQPHAALDIGHVPALLRPRKGRHGLVDYEKAFCPDTKPGADIFDLRGIDRRQGALVIVRPDQYVAHVLPLDAEAELVRFLGAILCA